MTGAGIQERNTAGPRRVGNDAPRTHSGSDQGNVPHVPGATTTTSPDSSVKSPKPGLVRSVTVLLFRMTCCGVCDVLPSMFSVCEDRRAR